MAQLLFKDIEVDVEKMNLFNPTSDLTRQVLLLSLLYR